MRHRLAPGSLCEDKLVFLDLVFVNFLIRVYMPRKERAQAPKIPKNLQKLDLNSVVVDESSVVIASSSRVMAAARFKSFDLVGIGTFPEDALSMYVGGLESVQHMSKRDRLRRIHNAYEAAKRLSAGHPSRAKLMGIVRRESEAYFKNF